MCHILTHSLESRRREKAASPTHEARAAFQLKALDCGIEIDDGERDLLAYLVANEKPSPSILVLTIADRAAIRAACDSAGRFQADDQEVFCAGGEALPEAV